VLRGSVVGFLRLAGDVAPVAILRRQLATLPFVRKVGGLFRRAVRFLASAAGHLHALDRLYALSLAPETTTGPPASPPFGREGGSIDGHHLELLVAGARDAGENTCRRNSAAHAHPLGRSATAPLRRRRRAREKGVGAARARMVGIVGNRRYGLVRCEEKRATFG